VRQPIEHDLKTWPEFFRHVWSGDKRFELRKNDRDFRYGDTLLMREWSPEDGYTGRMVRTTVLYELGGQWPGLESGYSLMSIGDIEQLHDVD
jgi:Domain of unknown function (DUF3850)